MKNVANKTLDPLTNKASTETKKKKNRNKQLQKEIAIF